KWLVAATAFFFMALASKPMAISVPFFLLLVDRWPLERVNTWRGLFKNPRLWTEKIRLFALSVASAAITIIAQHPAMASLTQVPIRLRIENTIVSYGLYAWKLIFPSKLAFLYPWPQHGLPFTEIMGALLFLLCMSVVAWKQRERNPWLMAGWLWF